MCAIVDANVAREVFGENRTASGREFFRWLNVRHGQLVVGGKAYGELAKIAVARDWLREGILSGRVRRENDEQVDSLSDQIEDRCASNDSHVIALARVSGARLLYSNDRALQKDFKNRNLINRPRGKIFTTLESSGFGEAHERLLNRKDLCGRKN